MVLIYEIKRYVCDEIVSGGFFMILNYGLTVPGVDLLVFYMLLLFIEAVVED